jgi:hypothetical protein
MGPPPRVTPPRPPSPALGARRRAVGRGWTTFFSIFFQHFKCCNILQIVGKKLLEEAKNEKMFSNILKMLTKIVDEPTFLKNVGTFLKIFGIILQKNVD